MEDFVLTKENYYSAEADKRYMSIHQYFDFVGTLGNRGCEERAMAKLRGEYKEETSKALLVGSYVDCFFEGTLDEFKKEHPDIFTRQGELKAEYKQAEKMIARCLKDDYFMQTMSGEKQKIFTAYMFGCDWKCKLDSYIPGVAIVDLKTSADIHRAWRVEDYGYVSFPMFWGYVSQLSAYQKIVEINTGEKLPCYISVVTKEESPEIAVINIDQTTLDDALNQIEMNMPTVLAVKNGEIPPTRCEKCNWCKATHKITKPISMMDLIQE